MAITTAWTGPGVSEQDASVWWKVQIGEYVLPGIATCEGFDREQDVDIKKSKGKDGATLEDNGRVLAEGRVIVEITAADHENMVGIMRELDPQKPGGIRTPRTIVHPQPNEIGVTQVYVKKIERSVPTAADGRVIIFHCVEWVPQPKKTQTKKKEAGSGQSTTVNSAIAHTAWLATQAANAAIAEAFTDADFADNTTWT